MNNYEFGFFLTLSFVTGVRSSTSSAPSRESFFPADKKSKPSMPSKRPKAEEVRIEGISEGPTPLAEPTSQVLVHSFFCPSRERADGSPERAFFQTAEP